jgi:heparan-alpha-glucosaminide N-acetyltransferase
MVTGNSGMTIALMILVDGAGETYNFWMDHAAWDGIRLADFVFPFFLFISGNYFPNNTKNKTKKNIPQLTGLVVCH